MKSRFMKSRPRLVPPENYQPSPADPWVEEKESDLTSMSSASVSSSEGSDDDESTLMTEELEGMEDPYDEEDSDEDEDNYSTLEEHTIDLRPTDHSDDNTSDDEEENDMVHAKYNEVTPLVKAIEKQDWEGIITFLETGSWGWKWSSLCAHLYSVSEKAAASQVRTWVTSKSNQNVEVSRLPLHTAIVRGAPYRVIELLIKCYPMAAKNPDSEGNYPLHLAFVRGVNVETTTLIMKQFQQAINIKNKRGLYPAECGNGRGVNELLQLCINATKSHVEHGLTKEKGDLEEDRKQLLEVTKELMHLKKVVAERERNMTKENFLYQKQHFSSAISQLTKLKTDLDKHEDNVLKHHLVAEKKRMEGVLGELQKTKGELAMVKADKKTFPLENGVPSSPIAAQAPSPENQSDPKKRKSKKSKRAKGALQKSEEPNQGEPNAIKQPQSIISNPEDNDSKNDVSGKTREIIESSATQKEDIKGTRSVQEFNTNISAIQTMEDPRDATDSTGAPVHGPSPNNAAGQERLSGAQSPKKLKNVAARFKKKMNWRKETPKPTLPDTE